MGHRSALISAALTEGELYHQQQHDNILQVGCFWGHTGRQMVVVDGLLQVCRTGARGVGGGGGEV